MKTKLAYLSMMFLLAACSDRVTFVTATNVGIAAEVGDTSGVNIGAERGVLYVGPTYNSGDLPPVISSFNFKGTVFTPRIKQLYATGAAASLVQLGKGRELGDAYANRLMDSDGKIDLEKVAQYGRVVTSGGSSSKKALISAGSTYGIDLGYSATSLGSFVFGFKRVVASSIPIETGVPCKDQYDQDAACDLYPSAIAGIDLGFSAAQQPEDSKIDAIQYFATGRAAELLALNNKVQLTFDQEAENSVGSGRKLSNLAKGDALAIVNCYSRASQLDRRLIARFGEKKGILKAGEVNDNGSFQSQIRSLTQWLNFRANIEDTGQQKAFESAREFACSLQSTSS